MYVPPSHAFLSPVQAVSQNTQELCSSRDDLINALQTLESAVLPEDVPAIADLSDAIGDFAVKVSLIGQVKAGKTALTNALLGVSDLLPSDVNPWTSVVTSIHVNREAPKGKTAVFKFFEESDWDDLVSDSGRIVKLAKKAKLDSRLDELTEQIEALKARTEARLGRNFKMLLGNQHAFSSFNSELVKRYVCLGEEDMTEDKEGRFADLTKSADLYMDSAAFTYPITLADTPGVNDPFLVREAATLDNLSKSDVFVVVLSAHQALSTVDLGLLRLLKSLHSNRLIVFVNRIDELPEPHTQIAEIRGHITSIFEQQKLSGDIPIIFGSAAWADAAVRGDYDTLPEDSVQSLEKLIEFRRASLSEDAVDAENIDNLADVSGVSALRQAIDQKAWDEVFDPQISAVARRARNIADRSQIYLSKTAEGPKFQPDLKGIKSALAELDAGQDHIIETLSGIQSKSREKVRMGMAGVYMSFIKAEKDALLQCLTNRKVSEWVPDTEGLRTELNSVYGDYVTETETVLAALQDRILEMLNEAYEAALGSSEGLRISGLPTQELPIPVSLMRTMSIDLRASSSLEWLRRKLDKSIYLEQLGAIASDDMRSTVAETCEGAIEPFFVRVAEEVIALLDTHRETIAAFAKTGDAALENRLKDILETEDDLPARLMTLRANSDLLHALETSLDDQPGAGA